MRQVKGVRGGYKAGKRGASQVKGYKVGMRQVKGVCGRYEAGKRGVRQVQGR